MKITLAYPWEGFRVDTTLELHDAIARVLVHDGRARIASADTPLTDLEAQEARDDEAPPARVVPLKYLTHEQLVALVEQHDLDVDLTVPMNRKQLLTAIEAATTPETSAPNPDPPAGGDPKEQT